MKLKFSIYVYLFFHLCFAEEIDEPEKKEIKIDSIYNISDHVLPHEILINTGILYEFRDKYIDKIDKMLLNPYTFTHRACINYSSKLVMSDDFWAAIAATITVFRRDNLINIKKNDQYGIKIRDMQRMLISLEKRDIMINNNVKRRDYASNVKNNQLLQLKKLMEYALPIYQHFKITFDSGSVPNIRKDETGSYESMEIKTYTYSLPVPHENSRNRLANSFIPFSSTSGDKELGLMNQLLDSVSPFSIELFPAFALYIPTKHSSDEKSRYAFSTVDYKLLYSLLNSLVDILMDSE